MKLIVYLYLFTVSCLFADIKSTNGRIQFDVNNDSTKEMTLNSNGLGIGGNPSSNLHVYGNAIVSQTLSIGSLSTNSNLHINGTIGFQAQTVTVDSNINVSSLILADTETASDNINLDLPFAGNVSGRIIQIKKLSSDHRVTLTAATNIDTSTSIVLSTSASALPYVSVMSDGNQWYVMDYMDANSSTSLPSSLSNLMLWLDANNGESLTYGTTGNISQWNDLSGNDRHATQGASGLQPIYERAAINGLSALKCDADQLNVTSGIGISADEARTILMVLRPESGYTNSEVIGLSTTQMIDFGNWSLDNRLRLRDTTHDGDGFSADGDVPFDQAHMISITSMSGNTSAYNGSRNILSSTSEYFHMALTSSVGIGGANQTGRRFKGHLGEVIVYNRVLSSSERNSLWQYLAQKWGVNY